MNSPINVHDIREIKQLHNPPESVKSVAGAILSLLGVIGTIDVRSERDPRLWKFFRNNIHKSSGVSLASRMETFDPKIVTKEQAEMAKRFLGDTTVEKLRNVSKAAISSYAWVCKAIKDTGY